MPGSIQAPPFVNYGYDPTTHLYLPTACTPVLVDATNNEEYALAQNVNTVTIPGSTLIFKSIQATFVTAGTPLSIWTPASGKKFRLLGFCVGGNVPLSVLFEDGTGNEFLRTPTPQSSNTAAQMVQLGQIGYLSTTANNSLFLDVTVTATISGFVFGQEE